MRIRNAGVVLAAAALSLLAGGVASRDGWGGMFRNAADTNGGGDGNKDIAVRRVTVTPVRAHVGEPVRVDVLIENKAEGHETVPLEISAGGKVVARKLFTFGWSPGDRMYRESITWDTRGVPPGEYRIRAEVFVWGDSSPFDNFLDAGQPVTLSAPGTPFPDGLPPGGGATEADPRIMNRPIRGGGGSQAETAPSGGY